MNTIHPILRAFSVKRLALLLMLTTVGALIIKPYFGYDVKFETLWLRLLIVGLVMMLTFAATDSLWYRQKSPRISLLSAHIIALFIGAFVGTVVSGLVFGRGLVQMFTLEPMLLGILVFTAVSVGIGTIATMVLVYRERAACALANEATAAAQKSALEKQVLEARLKLMQAQIEPHFLFNTLANVQHLVETQPPLAGKVLGDLIVYLRAALPEMREGQTRLGREADMARAYLGIQAVRMGQRLRFTVNLPTNMREMPFPPMMLVTLVENAVKHGIDPVQLGGEIHVSARDEGAHITLEVTDNGRGMLCDCNLGVGLQNIRTRLEALYGRNASLTLAENAPSGVIATLRVPK